MISIAVASYNGEKYIREQLDSILNQTIQDFEVVVCDDASTDRTWSILEEYKEKDKRFRIYKNEVNLGFKKNFEKAISLCKGNYIALSDQDDIWTNNHLEVLSNLIGDDFLACGNSQIVDSNGIDKGYDLKQLERFEIIPQNNLDLLYRILFFGNPFQGACMLVKKQFLDKALPIPENVGYHDAWFSAMATIQNGFKYTTEIINKYRQHETNVTSYFNKEKNIILKNALKGSNKNDRLAYCKAMNQRLDVENMPQEYRALLDKFCWYYESVNNKQSKLKLASFRFKNYSKIYSTNSYLLYIPRLIKFLIKPQ